MKSKFLKGDTYSLQYLQKAENAFESISDRALTKFLDLELTSEEEAWVLALVDNQDSDNYWIGYPFWNKPLGDLILSHYGRYHPSYERIALGFHLLVPRLCKDSFDSHHLEGTM